MVSLFHNPQTHGRLFSNETKDTFFNPYWLCTHPSDPIIFVFDTVVITRVGTTNACFRLPVLVWTARIHNIKHTVINCSYFRFEMLVKPAELRRSNVLSNLFVI